MQNTRILLIDQLLDAMELLQTGHGKGDGPRVVIKCDLTSEQLDNKGTKLQTEHDVVE